MVDIVVCTYGRPVWSAGAVLSLMYQTIRPERVIVLAEADEHLVGQAVVKPVLERQGIEHLVVKVPGAHGKVDLLNAGQELALLHHDTELVLFLDDDVWLEMDYLWRAVNNLALWESKTGGWSGCILNLGASSITHTEPTTRLKELPGQPFQTLAQLRASFAGKQTGLFKYQVHDWGDLENVRNDYRVEFYVNSALYKKHVLRNVGQWNKALDMAGEEIEYSCRVHRAGWRLLLDPRARAYHVEAGQGGVKARMEVDSATYNARAKENLRRAGVL